MAIKSLAGERFRKSFSKIASSGNIGGAGLLRKLPRESFAIARDPAVANRLHAFVLAKIFDDLAESQTDTPVGADEAAKLWGILGQPLIRYVDLILGAEPQSNEAEIVDLVLKAYFLAYESAI